MKNSIGSATVKSAVRKVIVGLFYFKKVMLQLSDSHYMDPGPNRKPLFPFSFLKKRLKTVLTNVTVGQCGINVALQSCAKNNPHH